MEASTPRDDRTILGRGPPFKSLLFMMDQAKQKFESDPQWFIRACRAYMATLKRYDGAFRFWEDTPASTWFRMTTSMLSCDLISEAQRVEYTINLIRANPEMTKQLLDVMSEKIKLQRSLEDFVEELENREKEQKATEIAKKRKVEEVQEYVYDPKTPPPGLG